MATDIPTIREIGISGGEPFLFLPLLQDVVRFARDLGFSSSVTTNGFWGRSARGPKMLEDLAASGLRAIHISTSVFHREFVAAETVSRAARMALHVGLKVTLNVVLTSTLSRRDIEAELGDLVEQVNIVVMPCLPAGRGRTDVADFEFALRMEQPHGNCKEHFRKLAVDLSGDVYPCCSPGGFTAPLRMGNLQNTPLDEILAASAGSKLLAILESVGPQFFLPFLRAAELHLPLPGGFSDQCHLCQLMLSEESYADTIAHACEQLFAELGNLAPNEMPQPDDRVARLAGALRTGALSDANPVGTKSG
jgi:MoaA/NifB/PqqE/SkfB family radical SAM enzyme